jgi:predicted secreted protein
MVKITITQMAGLLLTFVLLAPALLMAADAMITVTKAQSGREIALKEGDILQIELPAQGGTGYSWFFEANGAPHLQLMSESSRAVSAPRPGSPVMQVWRFKAEKPGITRIKMAYYRSWEGAGTAKNHFLLRLHIE